MKHEYFEVGQIVNTFGIKGFVKVKPFTDDMERFEELKSVLVVKNKELIEMQIEEVKYRQTVVLLKLKGVDNMNDAEKLKGCYLKIHRKDARKLMYGMDAFVFPSYQEGLPVSVIEAMSAGLPIIATDIRGNHDLIQSGKNGYLYTVNDTNTFIKEVHTLMNNIEIRKELGNQAQIDADEYSIENVDPKIMELYK